MLSIVEYCSNIDNSQMLFVYVRSSMSGQRTERGHGILMLPLDHRLPSLIPQLCNGSSAVPILVKWALETTTVKSELASWELHWEKHPSSCPLGIRFFRHR